MKKEDLRIVFLGTPEFAVATLDAIFKNGYNIVGVVTAPDRVGGRGMNQILESAVKKYAIAQSIKVLQPKNLKNPDFVSALASLNANLQIVVAFRMLPEIVWNMPKYGTYNLHGSLLPKYRGAAPINWAIMNGEPFTGVTSFKLKHAIDTGSIALQERLPIHPADYLDDVHDRMMEAGAKLIIRTIQELVANTLSLREQDESGISRAPKIFHESCQLDFNQDPRTIFNMIRGLSPYPGAWTILEGKDIKIFKAHYSFHHHEGPYGQFLTDKKSFLAISCKEGLIFCDELQVQGKRRMIIKDFLNGLILKENTSPSLRRIQSPWSY